MLHRRQPLLTLPVQRVNARGNASLAGGQVELKRLTQRPAVLERVEASRRHCSAPADTARKAGNGWRNGLPRAPLSPENPGSPWAEQPLVSSRDEKVAAQLLHGSVLHPEAVHAVHAKQHPVLVSTPGVHLGKRVRHRRDGELNARAGVHPGDRHDPRPGSDRAHEIADDLRLGRCSGPLVERDSPQGRAGFL